MLAHLAGRDDDATAVFVPIGMGGFYVLPFYFAGAQNEFVATLFRALDAHRTARDTAVPAFLDTLVLPGEAELQAKIESTKFDLDALHVDAAALARWRLLLAPQSTGTALEERALDALNVVLEGTGYRAEDRPDIGEEDFWIVGPDGDFALVEVKGTNTNILRSHVNQVDSNREAAGHSTGVPGLLIVNIFRMHSSLEPRLHDVSELAIARAATSNVLVMRTIDLFYLLHQKLARYDDAGQRLVDALAAGSGGWLRADGLSVDLRTA